jgi:hypothetical protein
MTLYIQLNTRPSWIIEMKTDLETRCYLAPVVSFSVSTSPSVSFTVAVNTYPSNEISPQFEEEVGVSKSS